MSKKEQELSEGTLKRLDEMKKQIIEEMVKEGWDRKKAEDQVNAFS